VEDNFGTATTTMSKFSDAYSNPFEDGGDINPFAYAAQAPASARSQPDTHNSPPATTPIAPSTQSTYIPPPISSDGHVPTARELELERRLKELEERQQHQVPQDLKPKNWPRCYPLVRHHIEEDITNPVTKRLVKFGYASWILHTGTLTINWIACLVALVSPGTYNSTLGTNFGISIVLWALCIPLSWVFWYRPLYNAAINERASLLFLFLCMYAINILFIIVMLIGPPSAGSTGFINMIQTFSDGKTPGGVACIISMAFWAGDLALALFLIVRVYWFFRGKNPKQELQGEVTAAAGQAIAANPQLASQVAAGAINSSAGSQRV